MLAGLDGVRKLAQACAYLRNCAPAGARLAQAKLAQALGA